MVLSANQGSSPTDQMTIPEMMKANNRLTVVISTTNTRFSVFSFKPPLPVYLPSIVRFFFHRLLRH